MGTPQEWQDLKREIVETRNQVIKTDNQVKNLSLDVKGFDKRFASLENRTKMASISVYVLLTFVIAASSYAVLLNRIQSYEQRLAILQNNLKDEQQASMVRVEALQLKLADIEKKKRWHEQAQEIALQVLQLLEVQKDKEAVVVLDKLDNSALGFLEQKLLSKRFHDLRQHELEQSFKQGRLAFLQNRFEEAITPLKRVLEIDLDVKLSQQSRLLLARSLYNTKKYAEAEGYWRQQHQSPNSDEVMQECQYYLAASLSRLQPPRQEEAKDLFEKIVSTSGPFSNAAKIYLQALQQGNDLPVDLPGGRVKVLKKAAPSQ